MAVTMDKEIWRPVVGYEGYYEVSNMGRVRSVERTARYVHANGKEFTRRVRARIMSPLTHKTQKRVSVMLSVNNVQKRMAVHRMVAMAFCENPHGYTEVNHIDEDPTNNRADNLEWCSRHYNMHYGTIKERVYDKNKKAIIAISDDGDAIRFNSISAAKRIGFSKHKILYAIQQGIRYDKFFWRYEDEQ